MPCELARRLIEQLLVTDASSRLGATDADAVRRDAFFDGIDWTALDGRRLPPPFAPLTSARLRTLTESEVPPASAPLRSLSVAHPTSRSASSGAERADVTGSADGGLRLSGGTVAAKLKAL